MRLLNVLPIIAGIAILLPGCSDNTESAEVKSIDQIRVEKGVPVRTEVVTAKPFESDYSYFAVLTGIEETTASSVIDDKVEKINYRVGARVVKDAIVLTFPTDNPAAQYYQAKVAYEHAETTLERIKNLYENGGISLQEYDNTRTQFNVAKANWETVRQSVAVKAPISGILTNLAVRVSDNVEAGDILFTIAKTNKLKTRIWASEHQIADIHVGGGATALWQDITLQGKVTQVDLSLDTSKQAFGVVVEFDNTESGVMSGVNAEVVIRGETADVIMTARKNVLSDSDSFCVYLAENDVAVKRTVTLGRNRGVDVEILDGLKQGDVLITEGQTLLEDNSKISIKD